MVTLNTAQTVGSIQQLNNPALLSKATEIDFGRQNIDKALLIASVLQTTLDIKKTIELFIFEASRWVPIDGLLMVLNLNIQNNSSALLLAQNIRTVSPTT